MSNPIRVIAVDDSAMARQAYRLLLTEADGYDLIATAPNASIARRKITELDPDVVILDIEMPGEDGLSLLKWLMEHFPVPVVVSSSWSTRGAEQTMTAFSLGAVEVVCKGGPASNDGWSPDFAATLSDAVRAASRVRRRARLGNNQPAARSDKPAATPPPVRRPVATADKSVVSLPTRASVNASAIQAGTCVVIGASTGGTEALARLIAMMPADFPPTLVVQHMPPIYTYTFAHRLDGLGAVRVREAVDGDRIGRGEVLVAPGGRQMRVETDVRGALARVSNEGPYNRHAPSVDILFHSAAEQFRRRTIGIILTGMGNDGARGLLDIHDVGGLTVAQDENSCVVFGMPQEAIKLGAASHVMDLNDIVPFVVRALSRSAAS